MEEEVMKKMKNSWSIIVAFVFLLFVASCGEKVYVCSDGREVGDVALCGTASSSAGTLQETSETSAEAIASTETSETTSEEILSEEASTETIDYTLTDSEKALLVERFGPSDRAELSQPLIKNMHAGERYVVALGLRNILGTANRDFVVEVKFREAKDFSNSVLPTDDELIQAWLGKNIFTTYTLDRGEETVIPIIIEVGDTLTTTGDPLLPGTYLFDIYIGYTTSQGNTDEYQDLLLTVQVTE